MPLCTAALVLFNIQLHRKPSSCPNPLWPETKLALSRDAHLASQTGPEKWGLKMSFSEDAETEREKASPGLRDGMTRWETWQVRAGQRAF